MVLLVLILVGAGTVLERATRGAPAGVRSQQKAQLMSRDVLEAAKQALIAYAVMDDNRPGTLPCPDYDNDGLYQPGVDTLGSNCASPIGWLMRPTRA